MVSAAAGLAAGGRIAFASTFGRFLERGFDQIEMALISGLPIKLVGSHVGVTLAADGPSQMALADVAFMRALAHARNYHGHPAVTVLTPSDAVSTYALTLAMAQAAGACYLRAVRADLPILYRDSEAFPFGGFKLLREPQGGGRQVLLAATGYMVHSCLKAAEELQKAGIAAGVVDAYSLPLDTAALFQRARQTPLLAVEDNYVGGLASELAEAAAEQGAPRVKALVVRNFPKSGRTAEDVLGYVHLSVAEIVDAARALAG
jgi:transketolase